MIEELKIATTLAEADEDSASAISTLKTCDISNLMLTMDQSTIANVKHIRDLATDNDIGIAGLEYKDIWSVDYAQLKELSYMLKPKFVKFNWDSENYDENKINGLIDCSIYGNFIPQICLNGILVNNKPRNQSIFDFMSISKRLSICFDPVEILMRYNIDVISEYFIPHFDKISNIVIRDYKVGVGNRPVGYGSINWNTIFSKLDKYNGWLIFKPSLGTRYNDLVGRQQIFKAAYSSFAEVLESCQ